MAHPAHTLESRWNVDDLKLGRPHWLADKLTRPRPLPVMDDPDAALWRDRVRPNAFWYAPGFQVVTPKVADDPESSPFAFRFETAGHDVNGNPGLEATVSFTLRRTMSQATLAAWEQANRPVANPVVTTGLSIQLEIPFRDETGTTRLNSLTTADLQDHGEMIVARFRMTDRWARLAYGALAVEGFQAEPARLSVGYSFEAYIPVPPNQVGPVIGRPRWRTRLIMQPSEPWESNDQPAVMGRTREIRLAQGTIRLEGEMTPRDRDRPLNVASIRPHGIASTLTLHTPLAIHPQIQASSLAEIVQTRKNYGIQTQGRTCRLDALMPCATLGMFYGQVVDDKFRSIGCQPAFQLGQAENRLYEEVPPLWPGSQQLFRILRCVASPGRFLVVPSSYVITRYDADDPTRNYRPIVCLFSTIDAQNIDKSRCVLMTTLAPDLAPFQVRRMMQCLHDNIHPRPEVEYVTETSAGLAYDWSIGGEAQTIGLLNLSIEAVKMWDGFQVSMTSDARGVPQLQAILSSGGIAGRAKFELADKTLCETALRIDLREIHGPWSTGPFAVTVNPGVVGIENRVESPVCVSELLCEGPQGVLTTVPVDQRIEPAAKCMVNVPSNVVSAWPIFRMEPTAATLPEIRAYVDDVTTNVVFLHVIDLVAHQIQSIVVGVRIQGMESSQVVELSATNPAGEAAFVLPLTQFLAGPLLQFQVSMINNAGQTTTGTWHDWRLRDQGNVIVINWDTWK
jgi:hypothetical protein